VTKDRGVVIRAAWQGEVSPGWQVPPNPYVYAGDPPGGVTLRAKGRPPVPCDVTRWPAGDRAGLWAWRATPRGGAPVPPGAVLAAAYAPAATVISAEGAEPLVTPGRHADPADADEPARPSGTGPADPGQRKPGPKPGVRQGPRTRPRKRRAASGPELPASEAAGEAEVGPARPDPGHPLTPASRAPEPVRKPGGQPANTADPGWCPDPPKGCGYHRNALGHRITCEGYEP
jgi:hypothetical protein